MVDVSALLKEAGFKPEVSTAGDKPILEGVYKATLVEIAKMEDKGYGESIYAQFKISETLFGRESSSQYPEFKDYYSLAADKIASKRNGLAKLINGLFSIGIEVDTTNVVESLNNAKGAEVFITAYAKPTMKQEDDEWVVDDSKPKKQAFTFMTEKNALKEAEKKKKASGVGF